MVWPSLAIVLKTFSEPDINNFELIVVLFGCMYGYWDGC